MLDHVFTDAIGALRDAFEDALLERQAGEERFQTDVLQGDVSWDNSYVLPGEGQPPRVCADVSCVWPTWSQAAYLSWYAGDGYAEPPRIEIKILLRAQCLAESPEPAMVLNVLPPTSPGIGRAPQTGRTQGGVAVCRGSRRRRRHRVRHRTASAASTSDVSYEGVYELDEAGLSDGAELDKHFNALGGWIASMLVRLGDLELGYRPVLDN